LRKETGGLLLADVIVQQKIDSLSRCISRIREKTPEKLDLLLEDLDIQDIISINLERAVQQCVDISLTILAELNLPVPASMGEAFEELCEKKIISKETSKRMINAVGFRNILVHAYKKIDWNIVWKIIKEHLDDFVVFAGEVLSSGV
jgi:uncharacterized protein YutE (UPF0331/DUF86 family)